MATRLIKDTPDNTLPEGTHETNEPRLDRYLIKTVNGDIFWSLTEDAPWIKDVLAYGWSDNTLTWGVPK